jgi:hypothetical protein
MASKIINTNEKKKEIDEIKNKLKNFIKKIDQKNKITEEDFNLYIKIKKENKISPLMLYILEKAIEKYNNNSINNNIEKVGFGKFPGITSSREKNNKKYFDSKDAFVLYASFPEEFIGEFWKKHQLLADLLGVNPIKEVLNSKLQLSKNSKTSISNKTEEDNNQQFYKLSLGANFEFNSLKYLLYGIKEYVNLPRIVFYPIIDYIEYEEIDSIIFVKEMKNNLGKYYENFKSINLENPDNRKNFELNNNDLVFIEASFDIEDKKKKIHDFFVKILSFIFLLENIKLIDNINNYKIRPIILYNNNYNIKNDTIDKIKKSINSIKITIKKLNNTKFEEIYENVQIIYCWPTMPLLNNIITQRDLNKKIEKANIEINNLKEKINNLENKIYPKNKINSNFKIIIIIIIIGFIMIIKGNITIKI